MDILVNFLMAMVALGVISYVVFMAIGKWQYSSRNVKVRQLDTLNQQALTAAKCAVEQFKSNSPVNVTCPDCQQLISVAYIEPPADSFVTKCKCQRSNRILRGVMGPPDWVLSEREQYKNKALSHSFLDAVFFVEYFNDQHGEYFQCPLSVTDMFPEADANRLEQALERSKWLNKGQNAYVGEAFFKNPKAFDRAVKKLKEDNPGFCEDVYQKVIDKNIRGMR